MIDKVTIFLDGFKGQSVDMERLQDLRRTDDHTAKAHIGAMAVIQRLGGVYIRGSLAKYLNGENCTPLIRRQVQEAIEKLEGETGLDLGAATVKSVETGTSVITKETPAHYLRLFGHPSRLTRNAYSIGGVETGVTYSTKEGAYAFTAYDKGAEMKKKREPMPAVYEGCNVVRLEYEITKRRGIVEKFHRNLTPHDLYDHDTYRELARLFHEAYRDIPKTGRSVFVDKTKHHTPAMLNDLFAAAYRQSCPDGYNHILQILKAAGVVNDKDLERERAKAREQGRDYTMSDKSELEKELDAKVKSWAVYGA